MAQLYLPIAHTEADLVLAGQLAELIDSAELYVAWTPALGQSAPEVVAVLREPLFGWSDTLTLVFQAVRELWSALLSRDSRPPAPALDPAADETAQPKPAAGEAAA